MASLLDRGPHTVVVIPKIKTRDRYGEVVEKDGEPVTVRNVSVQPYTSGQNNITGVKIKPYGTQVKTGYNILGRGPWPGGPMSWIEWNGQRFQQDGEAQIYGMSPATAHFEVSMTKQNVEMY